MTAWKVLEGKIAIERKSITKKAIEVFDSLFFIVILQKT